MIFSKGQPNGQLWNTDYPTFFLLVYFLSRQTFGYFCLFLPLVWFVLLWWAGVISCLQMKSLVATSVIFFISRCLAVSNCPLYLGMLVIPFTGLFLSSSVVFLLFQRLVTFSFGPLSFEMALNTYLVMFWKFNLIQVWCGSVDAENDGSLWEG
jgi:hypothetical protein